MSSNNVNSHHVFRAGLPIASVLVVSGLAATPSSARQDPGTPITPAGHIYECPLQRLGTQFVRCDNLTGNGVAAPGWIPRADATAARSDVPSPVGRGASRPAPTRTVRVVTTSGSAAGGFTWTSEEQFETTIDCATFAAHVAATVTDRFTATLDSDGTIARFTESVSAPKSVWTNTRTGASIVVAGHYIQVANHIPGTHDYRRTVTKSAYPVSQPQEGPTTKDIGGTLDGETRDDTTWSDLTGQHHFADAMLTDPTPCAAIA